MPQSYDTTLKALIAEHFLSLLTWLLPTGSSFEAVSLPTELPATLRRVDLMVRIQRPPANPADPPSPPLLIIFEFQCQRDPMLSRTILLRTALAHWYHDLPVETIVLAFTEEAYIPSEYTFGEHQGKPVSLKHTVRRVFDESADEALRLDINALLPLVPIMKPSDGDRQALLRSVVERIIEKVYSDDQRNQLLGMAMTMATLHLPSDDVEGIVKDICRRKSHMLDPLRDFPLLRKYHQQGVHEGVQHGILTLLASRGLSLSDTDRQRILGCTDPTTLDRWLVRAASASTLADALAEN